MNQHTHFGRQLLVRIPEGKRDFSLLHEVQTGYGAWLWSMAMEHTQPIQRMQGSRLSGGTAAMA